MDFLHRNANNQPQTVRSNGGGQPGGVTSNVDKVKHMVRNEPGWLRAATVVLLFSLTILAVGVTCLFYFGRDREAHYVDNEKVQAVFLTNGQVYFGKITAIKQGYVDLRDIYYLNSQSQPDSDGNTSGQPTSFSLVKLGCELHGPQDQMVINREQVSFWENLKSDGKVADAIKEWQSQNPDGQNKCDDDTSNSTQQSQSTGQGTETDTSAQDNGSDR
jgi:hypothetical protein